MIKINSLLVKYGHQIAVDIDKEIEIKPGDKVGIIGGNGAGKTSMINAILGLIPYQGQIIKDIGLDDIGVHLQFNEYSSNMNIKSVMETILDTDISKDKKLQELLEYFDMKDHLNKKYEKLSGGQKQKFTLIMVLYQDKKVTFFDEVTSGLDFTTRQGLMEKMVEWYKGKDTTVCLVSHYYSELEQLVDKIIYLEAGKLVAFGDKDELFHKYCGKRVYIIEKEDYVDSLSGFKQLLAPENNAAFTVSSLDEERRLVECLLELDIDYKRSSNDIELMTINAKKRFMEANYEREIV